LCIDPIPSVSNFHSHDNYILEIFQAIEPRLDSLVSLYYTRRICSNIPLVNQSLIITNRSLHNIIVVPVWLWKFSYLLASVRTIWILEIEKTLLEYHRRQTAYSFQLSQSPLIPMIITRFLPTTYTILSSIWLQCCYCDAMGNLYLTLDLDGELIIQLELVNDEVSTWPSLLVLSSLPIRGRVMLGDPIPLLHTLSLVGGMAELKR
jgi:hypothetical protein